MKLDIGRCLLRERLNDAGYTCDDLARLLQYKPERLLDYMENKRIMPLKVAVSIAYQLDCSVNALYEWFPAGMGMEETGHLNG
ncbi:helix-turn-helix domain-containing protein [Paenibacillus macerans]|uniref:helix-turn-helix domain-containing protein n=1 Tax=Paenibacillus macerans TaxID=44252 RepID=UPI003D3240B1